MVSERHNGVFRLSPKSLKEALHMPEGSEIYGMEWSLSNDVILVYVRDPSLPAQYEGDQVQPITLFLTQPEFQDGVIEGKWV